MRWFIILLVVLAAFGTRPQASADDSDTWICWDPMSTFNPLGIAGGCFTAKGGDSITLLGVAIVDDEYAPPGTPIEALVGDAVCGRGTGPRFEMQILASSQQAGCAEVGDKVTFTIGGELATEHFIWPEFHYSPWLFSLSAVDGHAWYWYERGSNDPPPAGMEVEAYVGDTLCGQATLSDHPPVLGLGELPGVRGFSRLVVPAASELAGCGVPGATVSFRIAGGGTLRTYQWAAGVQRIDIAPIGDANCSLGVRADDAAFILQLAAELIYRVPCLDGSDVNRDGDVNTIDASLVLQFVAGLIDELL
jgi:hypothetical protein